MRSARLVVAPVLFALRRLRARWAWVAALTLALAGAAGLVGWGSLMAALSQEDNVRLRLREMPARERSLQVLHSVPPGWPDFAGEDVMRLARRTADLTYPVQRMRVSQPIAPEGERGARLVAGAPRERVTVDRGALPSGCRERLCEALALAGPFRVGDRVSLGRGVVAKVVGRGSLAGLPRRLDLGRGALLVATLDGPLRRLVELSGSVILTTAELEPEAVAAARLRDANARLRDDATRLARVERVFEVTAPLAVLEELADRGEVARERLLLVSGQGAALILAFAAFAASARRRDRLLADEQLTTFGGSRAQVAIVRVVEALVPGLAASALALGGLLAAAWALADGRAGFVGAALPLGVVASIALLMLVAIALLLTAGAPRRRPRYGLGGLELAALAALTEAELRRLHELLTRAMAA